MAANKEQYNDISSVLEVNRALQVVVESLKSNYVYKSSIADFDRGSIFITPITREGRPTRLRNGDKVDVVYFGRDAMYSFESHVTGHRRENNISLIILEKPAKCLRIQRREFFRLPYKVEASFRKVSIRIAEGVRKLSPTGDPIPCSLEDISGGGLSFHASEILDDDSYVEVEFPMPSEDGEKRLQEMVKIIRTRRINPLKRKSEAEYIYSASFIALDDDIQKQIVHFIFQKQIQGRKAQRKSL